MKKSTTTAAEGLRTWQDIGQLVPARPITPVARRNQMMRWTTWGLGLGVAIALVALGAWALRVSASAPVSTFGHPTAKSPAALVKFDFKTDGVLTDGWVMNFLKLKAGDSIQNLDVFALRAHLLSLQQVHDATIERILPNTLRVSVQERKPWLRVAVDDGKGGFDVNLVSRDGVVFAPQDFPQKVMDQLPWMSGLALHRAKGQGYQPIAGMEMVADLMSTAQTHAPKIAAQWTVVNLSKFDPRPEAPISLIKIQSGPLGELTFVAGATSHDFLTQIQRLALVAGQLDAKPELIHGLDMSLPNQVVVQPLMPAPLPSNKLGRMN